MYTQQVKATHVSETPQTQCTKFLFTLWRPRLHIELVKPKCTESKAVKKIKDNGASRAIMWKKKKEGVKMYSQQVKATHVSETPQTQCTKFLFTLWRLRLYIKFAKPKGTESKAVKKIKDNGASRAIMQKKIKEGVKMYTQQVKATHVSETPQTL